jgi:hypothetical protein
MRLGKRMSKKVSQPQLKRVPSPTLLLRIRLRHGASENIVLLLVILADMSPLSYLALLLSSESNEEQNLGPESPTVLA